MLPAMGDRIHGAVERFVGGDTGRSVRIEVPVHSVVVDVGGNVPRPGASVLKLPLVLAVLDAARTGDVDLEAPVRRGELPTTRYPSLLDCLDSGHRFSLRELCGLGLATSDNPVANYLLSLIGRPAVQSLLDAVGCDSTVLAVDFSDEHLSPSGRANITTAGDVVRLLHHLRRRDDGADVVRWMQSGSLNFRIPLRLPEEARVAHKTGSLEGVVNDAGIVHTPVGDVIVAVLCDRQPDAALTSVAIGDLMMEVWLALAPATAAAGDGGLAG